MATRDSIGGLCSLPHSFIDISERPFLDGRPLRLPFLPISSRGITMFQIVRSSTIYHISRKVPYSSRVSTRNRLNKCLQCTSSSSSGSSPEDSNATSNQDKAQFGYTRKDVLLIGLGVTALGIGLKSGLEFVGVDPLQAGNVVQLVLVLGLTIGWISTYIFRVSNKEMTYAQQLRDYEKKVMEKRLEGLTEAELEALLEQVEEEKRRLTNNEQL
ncbi:uncharacterized protein LOC120265217 [Dioscorea cayenensis subsp. rotundata]|uniref:Uncharacterized protein LOC120265217 n=1 Tax=Dioscorea cayennensis subsp. rotundata TaxID=55577 RepID=A0AB40BP03_DIOCR|nr:uncharacterized protein LOC120265217 [Dioscorea cayenensis subsp. rotundata]